MKRISLAFFSLLFAISSCITSDEFEVSPRGDFEALWKIIDERYCFFDFKREEYGLDWQEVHNRYSHRVHNSLSERALFQILAEMTRELRDGHVNLRTPFDVGRYAEWYESYPSNYSDSLERKYLGTALQHQIAGNLKYRVLRNNVGYVRCASFMNDIGEGNLHEVMLYLSACDGLIIDVRHNGGGRLSAAMDLASSFCNAPLVVGYISHKTGTGHADFSSPKAITLKPAKGLRWQKPVVVLANRRTYSAANAFVMFMKALPNVTFVGDRTGGGSGMPFSSELPGGWSIRFSASPIYDRHMQHTEFGIEPDQKISISSADFSRGIDTILECAISMLAKEAHSSNKAKFEEDIEKTTVSSNEDHRTPTQRTLRGRTVENIVKASLSHDENLPKGGSRKSVGQ